MIVLPLALGMMLVLLTLYTGIDGLKRLAQLQLYHPGLAILACLAQAANVVLQEGRLVSVVLSACLLSTFCWYNRARAGMKLIVLGLALNAAVMVSNGGVMPVAPDALALVHPGPIKQGMQLPRSKAQVMDDATAHLFWLGDRLVLPGPLAPLAAWSLGDICLLLGVGQLLHSAMTSGRIHERTGT